MTGLSLANRTAYQKPKVGEIWQFENTKYTVSVTGREGQIFLGQLHAGANRTSVGALRSQLTRIVPNKSGRA